MTFRYAEPDQVEVLVKGGKVTGWKVEALAEHLRIISIRLSAWYPGLKQKWLEAPDDSDLKGLVNIMVAEAARKVIENSSGMSSETMGPYAYSKFDSEDPRKGLFSKEDIEALENLLAIEGQRKVRSFRPRGFSTPKGLGSPSPGYYYGSGW